MGSSQHEGIEGVTEVVCHESHYQPEDHASLHIHRGMHPKIQSAEADGEDPAARKKPQHSARDPKPMMKAVEHREKRVADLSMQLALDLDFNSTRKCSVYPQIEDCDY